MSVTISDEEYQRLLARIEALENSDKKTERFGIVQLSEKTGFKVNTLYKKIKALEFGVHYFKPNGGKLLFDDSCVDILVEGGRNGESIHQGRQSECVDNLLA